MKIGQSINLCFKQDYTCNICVVAEYFKKLRFPKKIHLRILLNKNVQNISKTKLFLRINAVQ